MIRKRKAPGAAGLGSPETERPLGARGGRNDQGSRPKRFARSVSHLLFQQLRTPFFKGIVLISYGVGKSEMGSSRGNLPWRVHHAEVGRSRRSSDRHRARQGLRRGVTLKFADGPKGMTLDSAHPVIMHGDV